MKKLKNLIKLSSRITVYVPSTTDVDKKIDNTIYVDNTLSLLSKLFGGATCTPAIGCWLATSGSLIKENTTVVFAYATEKDLQAYIDNVIDYCETLKADLKQEAISLEINGEMYFI